MIESGFKSRAGYNGASTADNMQTHIVTIFLIDALKCSSPQMIRMSYDCVIKKVRKAVNVFMYFLWL